MELSADGDVGNRGCDPVHREQGMLCGLVWGGGSQVAPDHEFQMGQMKLCKFDFFHLPNTKATIFGNIQLTDGNFPASPDVWLCESGA